MNRKPDWAIEGRDWPNRAASRFINADGLRWHVQVMGTGPELVLLHGTGAATHSWRDLAPLLAQQYTVVSLDLPGHGFTATPLRPTGYSLPMVARGVTALLRELNLSPQAFIGHSAGAAIAVRMAIDGPPPPRGIIGLNAALLPFPGPLGVWAPALAQVLFANPFSLSMFAYRAASPGAVAELIRGTGSTLDPNGLDFYERLFRTKGHLEGAIGLMSQWDLHALKRDLPNLAVPLTLIAGGNDRAVPPSTADKIGALVKDARITITPGLGHLAHEEAPKIIGRMILGALQQAG